MKKKFENIFLITGIVVFCIGMFSFCILGMDRYRGDDMTFHLRRICELAQEFEQGGLSAIPVRVTDNTLGGYGYGCSLFYGDYFLYLPAFAVAFLGWEALRSLQVFFAFIIIGSGISMFWALQKIGVSRFTAAIMGVLYAFSPYMLTNYVVRSALGEAMAGMFMPAAASVFYDIVHTSEKLQKKSIIQLACLMAAMLVSHLIYTAILCAIFMVWLAACLAVRLWHRQTVCWAIKNLFLAAALCIGISSVFLFPMLEQIFRLPDINAFSGSGLDPRRETMSIASLFLGSYGNNALIPWVNSIKAGLLEFSNMRPGAVIYPLIGTILCLPLCAKHRNKIQSRVLYIFVAAAGFILYIVVKPEIWNFTFLRVIQFPWRLLLIFSIVICTAGAIILDLNIRFWIKLILCGSFAAASLIYAYPMAICFPGQPSVTEQVVYDSYSVGYSDYLQKGTQSLDLQERGFVVKSENPQGRYIIEKIKKGQLLSYENGQGEKVELPMVMVYGYQAADLESGEKLHLESSEQGLVQLQLPNRNEGKIQITYVRTAVQRISEWITVAALLFTICWAIKKERKIQKA